MVRVVKKKNSEWHVALKNHQFKWQLWVGLIAVIIVLAILPSFFQIIQARQGYVINDPILNNLFAYNFSIPIFTIIWSMAIFFLIRSYHDPYLFLTYLYSFILLFLARYITISALPLEPPRGLVNLVDPLSNMFYGKSFITKDLFFSGHTATQWLFFLCFRRKIDKCIALFSSIAIGFLVMVQHVHYSIDVVAAPIFGTICYYISRKIVNSKPNPDLIPTNH